VSHLYVETSALLRVVLEGDEALRPLLLGEGRYTSALTFVEARRGVLRARLKGRLDASGMHKALRRITEYARSCEIVPLEDEVLRRAGEEFPVEPVRTLDAIHIATLQILEESLSGFEIATCDERVRDNAEALGFRVLPAR